MCYWEILFFFGGGGHSSTLSTSKLFYAVLYYAYLTKADEDIDHPLDSISLGILESRSFLFIYDEDEDKENKGNKNAKESNKSNKPASKVLGRTGN